MVASASPAKQAGNQGNGQKRQEYKKQDLRDSGRSSGEATKAKRTSDDGDDQKNKRPIKHVKPPCVVKMNNVQQAGFVPSGCSVQPPVFALRRNATVIAKRHSVRCVKRNLRHDRKLRPQLAPDGQRTAPG